MALWTRRTAKRWATAQGRRRKLRRNRPKLSFNRLKYGQLVYNYREAVDGIVIGGLGARTLSQAVGVSNYACEFALNDLGNYANFAAIYDQYRVNKIVVKLIPMIQLNGVQPIAGVTPGNPGLLATVVDDDDVTPLATLQDYEQYSTYRCQPAISTRTHTRTIYPKIRGQVLNAGGASVAANLLGRTWMDMAQPAVSYAGLKIYFDAYANANMAQNWQIQATYYVSFRSTR